MNGDPQRPLSHFGPSMVRGRHLIASWSGRGLAQLPSCLCFPRPVRLFFGTTEPLTANASFAVLSVMVPRS